MENEFENETVESLREKVTQNLKEQIEIFKELNRVNNEIIKLQKSEIEGLRNEIKTLIGYEFRTTQE